MAGIGFELRKLFREQGLLSHIRAYAYSSLTTIGPMLLSMALVIALHRMMIRHGVAYLDRELYMATVQYAFIFSMTITSGLTMVLTRFVADMIFRKKYEHLMSSYYGGLMLCLPAGALTAWLFLRGVSAEPWYKFAAYLFFMELIVVWMQAVYLSALKDYMRIVRSYALGAAAALLGGWLLMAHTPLGAATSALLALDIGFLAIGLLSAYHFRHRFPPGEQKLYFSFLSYFRKFPSLFWSGTFFYAGVFVHSFVYWFGPEGVRVADGFLVSPGYDLPVFYAFISVIPTLVTFVVSVETAFYEKFRAYYKEVREGGTFEDIARTKREMQRTLSREISFLMEVQLLFTVVSIAVGILLLPRIGFSMAQSDAFNLLVLGYFLYIMMFILTHILMYFDDRKGVFAIGTLFVALNAALSYWSMLRDSDGLGMFLSSFIALCATIARLVYLVNHIDYYTFCSQPIHTAGPRAGSGIGRGRRLGKRAGTFTALLLLAALLAACTGQPDGSAEGGGAGAQAAAAGQAEAAPQGLSEDKRIYEQDDDGSVKALYVTIMPEKGGDGGGLTWYGLNRRTGRYSEESMDVLVQEGAEGGSGPQRDKFGYGASEANAKVSLRGNTARYASQKSYKIKLYDEAGLWQNQRTINLNKHPFDLTRVRNKLGFDLMENIPDMTSLRTQFVRLYVKDLSEGGSGLVYEDYGLYTQVEQPNEMFLKSHWLDPYGQLYKAAFFEFYRYPEQIKSQSDPTYDKKAFETILEIKGREDHDKLIAMLDDVNDMSIPIDEVMEKHFDLDNYLTWMAVNILTDNMDTNTQNFYLYSPLNSDKWYFLPWDYDGGWGMRWELDSVGDYQNGLSNYWGSVLHNRFFRSKEHVELLKNKIDELSNTINKASVERQLALYEPTVRPFLLRAPDLSYLPGPKEDIGAAFDRIAETPETGKKLFLEDLEKPKPFFLGDVVTARGKQTFSWGLSFDLQGDDLVYDWIVASDPAFARIVAQKKGLKDTTATAALGPGVYYWKVVVRDGAGHRQIAFDSYQDHEGTSYYGVREFEVE